MEINSKNRKVRENAVKELVRRNDNNSYKLLKQRTKDCSELIRRECAKVGFATELLKDPAASVRLQVLNTILNSSSMAIRPVVDKNQLILLQISKYDSSKEVRIKCTKLLSKMCKEAILEPIGASLIFDNAVNDHVHGIMTSISDDIQVVVKTALQDSQPLLPPQFIKYSTFYNPKVELTNEMADMIVDKLSKYYPILSEPNQLRSALKMASIRKTLIPTLDMDYYTITKIPMDVYLENQTIYQQLVTRLISTINQVQDESPITDSSDEMKECVSALCYLATGDGDSEILTHPTKQRLRTLMGSLCIPAQAEFVLHMDNSIWEQSNGSSKSEYLTIFEENMQFNCVREVIFNEILEHYNPKIFRLLWDSCLINIQNSLGMIIDLILLNHYQHTKYKHEKIVLKDNQENLIHSCLTLQFFSALSDTSPKKRKEFLEIYYHTSTLVSFNLISPPNVILGCSTMTPASEEKFGHTDFASTFSQVSIKMLEHIKQPIAIMEAASLAYWSGILDYSGLYDLVKKLIDHTESIALPDFLSGLKNILVAGKQYNDFIVSEDPDLIKIDWNKTGLLVKELSTFNHAFSAWTKFISNISITNVDPESIKDLKKELSDCYRQSGLDSDIKADSSSFYWNMVEAFDNVGPKVTKKRFKKPAAAKLKTKGGNKRPRVLEPIQATERRKSSRLSNQSNKYFELSDHSSDDGKLESDENEIEFPLSPDDQFMESP